MAHPVRLALLLAALIAPALIAPALLAPAGAASPMQVTQSRPATEEVMHGDVTEFFVRFSAPVDHATAVLQVLEDGHLVQTLHARLRSQPNTLYAGVRRLTPGAYTLHWQVRAMAANHEVTQGEIVFVVN